MMKFDILLIGALVCIACAGLTVFAFSAVH